MSRKFWNWVRNDNDERILMLNAYKLHVAIKVTEELLYDAAFNLEGYIIDNFGKALANAEEDAVAYLYEHREEADHKGLALTLRALLAGLRIDRF